jgi:hypothetical protein
MTREVRSSAALMHRATFFRHIREGTQRMSFSLLRAAFVASNKS